MIRAAAMSQSQDRTIRKFNPGTFQSDAAVIDQFVVRRRHLDIVLEVLRGNIGSPSCQHILLVGPRGRGKTMLLARIGAELRTHDGLSDRLFPVRFMEESQEVFNLADFWLEALFHIARECVPQHPDLAREARETHAALAARWQDETLEERARGAVLEAADRLGRRLVLMVENLQALCDHVNEDFGWKLRQVLQSEPQIMLIGAATSRFRGLDDATEPFFELFRIVELEPLDNADCRRLWRVISGEDVSSRAIRPLQILTGGSPRLLVIMGDFVRYRSLPRLMEELVKLVDDHTEYFRGHLDVLAKTERRVYLAVIDLWRPSSTGEIAARARMDVRTVSTMLGRLVDRGAVVVEGSGRKRQYAASERLYCVYYKLRRERDEAAVVRHLIRFMAVFYTATDLAEMSAQLMADARESPVLREEIVRAVVEEMPVGGAIAPEIQARVAMELINKGVMKDIAESDAAIAIYDEVVERFGTSDLPQVRGQVARALLYKGHRLSRLRDAKAAIATFGCVSERFRNNAEPEVVAWSATALYNRGALLMQEGGDSDAATATFDELVERFSGSSLPRVQVEVASAMRCLGILHDERGELEAALDAFDAVVHRFGASGVPEVQVQVAAALFSKGFAHARRGAAAAATRAFKAATALPQLGGLPGTQSDVFTTSDSRSGSDEWTDVFAEALNAYDAVSGHFDDRDIVELQVTVAHELAKLGITLSQAGELAGAIEVFGAVRERFQASEEPGVQVHVATALFNTGVVQRQQGNSELAVGTLAELVSAFDPSDRPELRQAVASALLNMGDAQIDIGHADDCMRSAQELARRFGTLTDSVGVRFGWRAGCLTCQALLAQGQRQAAMRAFQSVYSEFIPGSEAMMQEMLGRVPVLVAMGATAGKLIEIVSSDRKRADSLTPLVVALRLLDGQPVRAPTEVLEVAFDVRERIRVQQRRWLQKRESAGRTDRPGV